MTPADVTLTYVAAPRQPGRRGFDWNARLAL